MDIGRYREDEHLKKGEAQLYQLQQQVDELRRLMREQIARQHSLEDNWKQSAAQIYQLRDVQDRVNAEYLQAVQLRDLEDQRIKQDVTDLQMRVGEPLKPIRELRAQITELAETRRKDLEQFSHTKFNAEKLETSIRDLNSQIGVLDNNIKDLREAIKITANAQEFYQRELERMLSIIHTNEQYVVRMGEELREEIKSVRAEVQLYNNRIARLEDLQRVDAARIEEFPPQFEVLRVEDERVAASIVRVEKIAAERIVIQQERLEEIRQQAEGQFFAINQVVTGQADSFTNRIEQLDERIRRLDAIILDIQLRIEQVKQVEDSEIYDLYQLEEMLLAKRVEMVQAEYDMMRQHRAKSQAGGLAGRRAARARSRGQENGQAQNQNVVENRPPDDSSI